jgi:hypothetical protein
MSADATRPPLQWIGGRAFDLTFFFGSSVFAVAVAALVMAHPVLVVPLWWAWIFLVDGPHLFATLLRTYLDPEEWSRHRRLFWGSLLWISPGFVAFAATKVSGNRMPYDLFLLFASLWAYHHAVRQHWGILAVYERLARAAPAWRRWDLVFVHAVPWGMYGLFLLTLPFNRTTLLLPAELTSVERAAASAAVAVLAVWVFVHGVTLALRWRADKDIRPAVFALGPVVVTLAFGFFVVGPAEPLVPHPLDPEQFFLTTGFVGGFVHGVHYLAMVASTNRRRHGQSAAQHLAARLGRAPLAAYAFLLGLALVYVAINLLRGNAPGSVLPLESDGARLTLALYWGLFFHHYYLDQKIWKPSHDVALRAELGLVEHREHP